MTKVNFPSAAPNSLRVTRCRLCLSNDLELLFSLKPTPPAEWYFPETHRKATERLFALDLFFCQRCFHVQLVDVIDPVALFSNYFYESQSSPGLHTHFKNYASHVAKKLELADRALVVDVGSNDGTLLQNFQILGYRVAGIEPSENLSSSCNSRGILTYKSFMNSTVTRQILSELGSADLVTANNVFAHNDDLRGMAECISNLLKPGGFFVFEVSSILHTMKSSVFDYIYHEHLSYHSLMSLIPFLNEFGLRIFDIDLIETKGGSYRIYAQKGKSTFEPSKIFKNVLEIEHAHGLENPSFYKTEMKRIGSQKDKLWQYLKQNPNISSLIGYGASATTTTLVYEFDLIHKIRYLVDDNPIRHDCLLPGTDIRVFAPEHIKDDPQDTLILLAWRFSELIIPKIMSMHLSSKLLIKPLPEFQTIKLR